MASYSIGLDFGTNSVRALIVNTGTGEEAGSSIFNYPHGEKGILTDRRDPNLARQHPRDYIDGIKASIRGALSAASRTKGFSPARVVGIGVDTTGSTPLPVDRNGTPLGLLKKFSRDLNAMAWLWKDHTAVAEAAEITALAKKLKPGYLAKCGGTYSSEWYWAKILHAKRVAPAVFKAAFSWVEHSDWVPALLTGNTDPLTLKRGICAAGHKGMFNPAWGGYPDGKFLAALDPALTALRKTLPEKAYNVSESAGLLSPEWCRILGLPAVPVAVGAFDAHLGAVGSGIRPGVLVKIIGTSTCDIAVAPLAKKLPDVPGLCGIVPESVLPGQYGLEAGQSAVGDIFNWFVDRIRPGGRECSHDSLAAEALKMQPGESGLLALDWNNGNRTVLVDQKLTGLLVGTTLHTTPAEVYRALIEATAFGARVIIERFEEYGISIDRVVNCGGISVKSPLTMQIYADVLKRPLQISRSTQTCALGAAMAGAVVAGRTAGGHNNFAAAAKAMTGVLKTSFKPLPANVRVYDKLFELYKKTHDAFGTPGARDSLYPVMKSLIEIRTAARAKGQA